MPGATILVRPGYSDWTLDYLVSLRGAKKLLSNQPFQNISPSYLMCTQSKELGCVRERGRRGRVREGEVGGERERERERERDRQTGVEKKKVNEVEERRNKECELLLIVTTICVHLQACLFSIQKPKHSLCLSRHFKPHPLCL